MTARKIVIPDDDPVAYGGMEHADLRRLTRYGEVDYYGTRYADREEFFRRIVDADAVINVRGYSRFDDEALERAPRLKLISILGTGTDNVDLEAARRRGVTVTNTPGSNSESVAEMALALTLAVARTIP